MFILQQRIKKLFTKKFDYVCPVWLSIKRISVGQFRIEGAHDIDSNWIAALKEKNSDIRIVPRILFDRWPAHDIHALSESEHEKQLLSLTLKNFLMEYNQLFDGYVLEIFSQFYHYSHNFIMIFTFFLISKILTGYLHF